jgi:hypothetical protein
VKFRGLKVIGSMSSFLSEMTEQKRVTERILLQSSSKVNNATLSVPVIISEYNFDKFDNKNRDITVSQVQLSGQTRSVVKNAVNQNLENLHWQDEKGIDKEIKNEFSQMLSHSSSSQRVKDMANKLFLASNFQTVKNGAL